MVEEFISTLDRNVKRSQENEIVFNSDDGFFYVLEGNPATNIYKEITVDDAEKRVKLLEE